ncbi:MAG: D-serine ammonia-lyase [Clostridia bacterium]|nr:D-serine ammonia-lyase [Clostridia bacterium]
MTTLTEERIQQAARLPVVAQIMAMRETFWQNDRLLPFEQAIRTSVLSAADVKDASDRLKRFAAYFKAAFPETAKENGLIESPLCRIPQMQQAMEKKYQETLHGELLIKLDSHLAVSGSIKARGGIYEVLCVTEQIAMEEGYLQLTDDYSILCEDRFKTLFGKYSIAVGSTGNLGLSIGIIGAKLGFRVTVHMSADARQWKKDMLRSRGVTVREYQDDYSIAVENGRKEAQQDPFCHFVDDEKSKMLFLGYSVAAERLKQQLDSAGITISREKPLYVYLPCGVGGGPGGVAFGLKLVFGDLVHCYFAEPIQSCCMMLGMATGLHNEISVNDLGLSNCTIADGLAVGRASGFVGKQMTPFMDGCYSVADGRMSALLKMLADCEDIHLEPSALAGMFGPVMLARKLGRLPDGYHLVWATGGSMVPPEEQQKYYQQGEEACTKY